ncbi:hypothetical protein KI387_004716, partial [Taxus chinensis]
LFGRNDRIRDLEVELKEKEEEIATLTKKLSQENLINTQWQRELKDEKAKVSIVYKKVESINWAIILKHPDLALPTHKYGYYLGCLEDLTRVLTMEREPPALEFVEEVVTCLEKEDKLKIVALVVEYRKVLTDIRASSQNAEAMYDNCVDRDKVTGALVSTHEAELKEFQ